MRRKICKISNGYASQEIYEVRKYKVVERVVDSFHFLQKCLSIVFSKRSKITGEGTIYYSWSPPTSSATVIYIYYYVLTASFYDKIFLQDKRYAVHLTCFEALLFYHRWCSYVINSYPQLGINNSSTQEEHLQSCVVCFTSQSFWLKLSHTEESRQMESSQKSKHDTAAWYSTVFRVTICEDLIWSLDYMQFWWPSTFQ